MLERIISGVAVFVVAFVATLWIIVAVHTAPVTPICPQQLPQVQHALPDPGHC